MSDQHIVFASESGLSRADSVLDPGLVQAYLATNYHVQQRDEPFGLSIGRCSKNLERLYIQEGCRTAAFVTAWNPRGASLAHDENSRRQRALLTDVESLGLPWLEGEGRGQDSAWPPEDSLLLLGPGFEQAIHLGRTHDQNAIVWAAEDATPVLVLLR